MIKVYLLGTAGGLPTEKRYAESVAIIIDKNIYLLDGGEPCSASLLRKGINYNNIKAIFISHMHVDHFGGIPMLIQLMQLNGKYGKRENELKLFVPGEAIKGIRRYLETIYLMDELLPFRLHILSIKNNPVYKDKYLTLSAQPNKHLQGIDTSIKTKYPEIRLESYSFSLIVGNKKIVYSGDIRTVDELGSFVEGVDLLITEMGHVLPEELFKFLAGKDIKRIIFTHFHPARENKNVQYLELGKKYLSSKIEMGYDGMVLEL